MGLEMLATYHALLVGYSPRVVLPRLELHVACAGFQLLLASGSPPSDVGVLWSTVKARLFLARGL